MINYATLTATVQDENDQDAMFKRTFSLPTRVGQNTYETVDEIKEFWGRELAQAAYGFGNVEYSTFKQCIKIEDVTHIELMKSLVMNLGSLTDLAKDISKKLPKNVPNAILELLYNLNETVKHAGQAFDGLDEDINEIIYYHTD